MILRQPEGGLPVVVILSDSFKFYRQHISCGCRQYFFACNPEPVVFKLVSVSNSVFQHAG